MDTISVKDLSTGIKILALIVPLISIGGGVGGLYVQGQKDQKVIDKIDANTKEINTLKLEKVDRKTFIQVDNILTVIHYDVCMLRANGNHAAEARCEETRNARLTKAR